MELRNQLEERRLQSEIDKHHELQQKEQYKRNGYNPNDLRDYDRVKKV